LIEAAGAPHRGDTTWWRTQVLRDDSVKETITIQLALEPDDPEALTRLRGDLAAPSFRDRLLATWWRWDTGLRPLAPTAAGR